MSSSDKAKRALYVLLAATCLLWPAISSGVSLALGLIFGLAFGNPFLDRTKTLTPKCLAIAVTGLGAAMNLNVVADVGLRGFSYTLIGIGLTLGLGWLLGRTLKVSENTAFLVSVGTAICGGSAIAAVSSVLKPKAQDISLALGIVFLLNALALFLFPRIGFALNMTQEQFGLWSALAIHDTSSVVGATLSYGQRALEVGTTVKLARALWIVPVTLGIGFVLSRRRRQGEAAEAKFKAPWFILGFLIAAAIYTWVPALREACLLASEGAKRLMVLTLFLIGSNINRSILQTMGPRPLVLGVSLWFVTASLTLVAILQNWIHL